MTATKRCNTIQHVISIAVHTAAVEGFEDNVVLHAHTLRELRRACGYARKPQTHDGSHLLINMRCLLI